MLSGARAFQGTSMAKRPADRFQTIAEVRAALEKALAKPADTQPSIAVLPFANRSRDAADEYCSDGLAEEIINLLVHVPGLKVTARTSAFAFRGVEQDITKIAAALAGALQLKLSIAAPARRMPTTWRPTRRTSSTAPFTPDESWKSKECLEQALALDPQFALPYVGLADFHLALFMFGAISLRANSPSARSNSIPISPKRTACWGSWQRWNSIGRRRRGDSVR